MAAVSYRERSTSVVHGERAAPATSTAVAQPDLTRQPRAVRLTWGVFVSAAFVPLRRLLARPRAAAPRRPPGDPPAPGSTASPRRPHRTAETDSCPAPRNPVGWRRPP